MSDKISRENSTQSHQLQCMEIWNGNHSVENVVSSQGIEGWIFSRPYSEDLGCDDTTLIALKFIGNRRRPGFIEKLQGYSKLLLGS